MKVFVALCTIATLCFIQASVLEDYDAEDLKMEMGRDLEEYDGEDLAIVLRDHPQPTDNYYWYCEEGWGGHCYFPADLLNHTCDFIENRTYIWNGTHNIYYPQLCAYGEYCCVDCYAQKQYDNCGNIAGLVSPTRRECCAGTIAVKTMISGCNCCTTCKPKRHCRKKDGRFCVKKNDPVCSNQYCLDNGGRLKSKHCEGKHCSCCIGAKNPARCGY